jgi:hypothetical protein
MRRLPMVIWLFVVLVAVVTGCGGAHRYDGRLVAADSLMCSNPDSALAMLESLPVGSLTTEGDRAYHGLLISQARYKAYVTATSDSDINRALAYYRKHSGEREKLTRSYIYKGAVMEELGHPDSAMYYYKSAEAAAAPDDYFNLGYSKMRMGYLYGAVFEMDGIDIEKYKEAVECFYHTTDTDYQIMSLNNLGCVYRSTRPDDAMATLNKAMDLACKLNDTLYIIVVNHSKIVLLHYQQQYEKAHQLIQTVLQYQNSNLNSDFYFIASKVYSRVGLIDSARLLLNSALQYYHPEDPVRRMYYLDCIGEIALAQHDSITYLKSHQLSQHINDSLESNYTKHELIRIENGYEKNHNLSKQRRQMMTRNMLSAIIIFVVLILIAFIFIHNRRIHRYDRLINELRQETLETNNPKSLDIEPTITDQHLKDFISKHTAMMRDVIEECYHAPNLVLSKNIRKIIQYQEKNKDAWVNLFSYIDMENNNIITETKKNFPQLDEKEIMIVALTTMGYSCAQIAIILGYSSAQGITTVRNRVAKKMGLDCRLIDYIEKFKGTHQ